MQVIRLARVGRNKYPTYRIVSADKRRAATGKYMAVLGHYNPHTKVLVIKKEELVATVKNGAQPSNAVLKLMKQEGIKLPDWAEIKTYKKAPKKEVEEAPEASAEVATAEATAAEEQVAPKEESETPKEAEKAEQVAEKLEEVAEVVEEIAKDEAAKPE